MTATEAGVSGGVAMTPAQLTMLRLLPDKGDSLMPRGKQIRLCEKLERLGFAVGELEPAVWDSRRGITTFIRCYMRTAAGKKAAQETVT